MQNNKKFGNFGAKGYYIALILCAAAIGISGYLYYRNANQDDTQLQNPPTAVPNVDVIHPSDDDVAAVGTQPGENSDSLNTPTTEPSADAPVVEKLKTCRPLQGSTVAQYAMECLAYNQTTRDWRTHDGIDIAAEAGTKVCAAADGTVYTVYNDDYLGMTVVIRHDSGYVTVYSSLDNVVSVAPGDKVTMGQTIGTVGNTALLENAIGDHLHFSVTCNGEAMDPEEFFGLE